MLLLTLLGCKGATDLIVCPGELNPTWAPELEPELRLDQAAAAWVAEDGGVIVQDATQVRVSGGGAVASTLIDRGMTYAVRGTVAGGLVEVRHDGSVLATSGAGPFELAVTPTENSDTLEIAVVAEGDEASLTGLEVEGTQWAELALQPQAPLDLAFLIHIEDDRKYEEDEDWWRLRAAVIEGLTRTLHAHGAALTVQADITFIRGAMKWSPTWVDLREAEDTGWSMHLHDESGGLDAFLQAARDARSGFNQADIGARDLNGGFGLGVWDELADVKVESVTAYKDATTQLGLPLVANNPWRLAPDASSADPAAFMVHDPDGPVIYLPGDSNREADPSRFPSYARRALSQVYAHATTTRLNTWYFMLHIDGFGSTQDYVDGGGLDADLAWYDQALTELTDPLVTSGDLRYLAAGTMRTDYEKWESSCSAFE